jgi:hypothetical protein
MLHESRASRNVAAPVARAARRSYYALGRRERVAVARVLRAAAEASRLRAAEGFQNQRGGGA